MSLNVTYDQCYYGIVKMRDETEARIPLLHIPSFYPSCSSGAGIRAQHDAKLSRGMAGRLITDRALHRPTGRVSLRSCILHRRDAPKGAYGRVEQWQLARLDNLDNAGSNPASAANIYPCFISKSGKALSLEGAFLLPAKEVGV